MGYCHRNTHCKGVLPTLFLLLTYHLQAVYWIETKGKTLEEIDAIFEGEKHSSVPDVALIREGLATIDVAAINVEVDDKIKDL